MPGLPESAYMHAHTAHCAASVESSLVQRLAIAHDFAGQLAELSIVVVTP
jgi:hypothetical protein